MKVFVRGFVVLAMAATLSACSGDERSDGAAAPRVNVPFTPEISINEIMVAQIDHAAHHIWDAAGIDNPQVDVDWQEVEHYAIQLISSRAAMTMGGTGVNDQMWVAQTSWREYVNQMNDAGQLALTAARAQNQQQLVRASAMMVETCESCHQQFKPSIPTEGYSKQH